MGYSVTFDGYHPSDRPNEQPWTVAYIFEAPEETGPWTFIDQLEFNPEGTYTTEFSTLPYAWYKIIFSDDSGDRQETQPQYNGLPWEPSVQDVADLLMSRVRTSGGQYVGTFDETTLPTGAQVQRLIEKATERVAGKLGTNLSGEAAEDAANIAAIGAAMFVELSFFPEQIDSDRSPYSEYKELWDEVMNPDETTSETTIPQGSVSGPSWSFETTDSLIW
jgi:hypothetical protein